MKYSLTHCYTDHNKGDAAIIVSTVQLIKELDANAEINMFSTFGPTDDQFKKEHDFIKTFASGLYPGLFYQPRPLFSSSDASRLLHFIWISFKFSVLMLTKNRKILKLFFSKLEINGISKFMESDVILSKGGSYITTQNKSVRQSLSLITMLYPFLLAKRYKKKMYIFSQSLGPVIGAHNQWLMKKALSGIEKIYLRESTCLERYNEVQDLKKMVPMVTSDVLKVFDLNYSINSKLNFAGPSLAPRPKGMRPYPALAVSFTPPLSGLMVLPNKAAY